MSHLQYVLLVVTLLVGAAIVSCGDYVSCLVAVSRYETVSPDAFGYDEVSGAEQVLWCVRRYRIR